MAAGGRLYVSTVLGATEADVEKTLRRVLKKAGFRRRDVIFANRYAADGIAVKALPGGAAFGLSGVAVKGASASKSGCTRAGDAVYCTATAGAGADIQAQVNAVMTKLGDGLKANGLGFEQVTATNVWLDNLADFQSMNKTYGSYFGATPPARTTVQPRPPTGAPLVRISLVAVE